MSRTTRTPERLSDNDRRRVWACRGGQVAIIALGATLFFGLKTCDNGSIPEPTTTTTTKPSTTTSIAETTTTTTKPSTTTSTPKETFSFSVGEINYDCEILEPPHTVVRGDNLWKIAKEQTPPEDLPPSWDGMMLYNLGKKAIASGNPNLIYAGEIITTLHCRKSASIPVTK